MNRKTVGVVVALVLVAGTMAWGQQMPGRPMPGQMPSVGMDQGMGQKMMGGARQGDPMMDNFFPPELIMQNQKMLGLKEDQQADIRKEMQKTMAQFTDLQWRQSAETETMTALLKQDRPDEKQVLAQLDKLLAIEGEIKRLHLGMLIRIKNLLTADQQAKLREIKTPMMRPQGMMGPMAPRVGAVGRAGGAEGMRPQPGAQPGVPPEAKPEQ